MTRAEQQLNQLIEEQKAALAALPSRIHEQLMWSNGLRYADPIYRFDEKADIRETLLNAGKEELAFWRGLFEGSGGIGMAFFKGPGGIPRDRPRFHLYGSKIFLWTLFEWIYDRNLMFDRSASAIYQCRRRVIALQGRPAQELVQILWPTDDVICYETNRRLLREIKGWIPRAGSYARQLKASTIVDLRTLKSMTKITSRPPYKHFLDILNEKDA